MSDITDDTTIIAADRAVSTELDGEAVILDTAGRHQIDPDLIEELKDIHRRTEPQEVLLVADAALGQEAVSVAQNFDEALQIDGIILTKLDGDARGGAALSMRQVTERPIKYVGSGETLEDFEPFYPDRMASRILGMGDVVSLVEKANEQYEEEEAERLEEKMRQNRFDLEDFLDQMQRLKGMGGLASLMELIPGMGSAKESLAPDDDQLRRTEGMICSMTPEERRNPDSINMSRRRRIARGSGVNVEDVSGLLKQFQTMRKMMKNMNKHGGDLGDLQEMMGMDGAGMGGNETGNGTQQGGLATTGGPDQGI